MPPKLEVLRQQPRWLWFMVWGELYGYWQERKAYQALCDGEQTLCLEDLSFVDMAQPRFRYPLLRSSLQPGTTFQHGLPRVGRFGAVLVLKYLQQVWSWCTGAPP